MLSRVRQVAPGLARAVGVAGGALAASAVVSVGAVPLALIAGALVPARWLGSGAKPGLAFASTAVLRAGVVCVGFKMNLGELAALGAVGLPCVAASVATGLFVIPRLAKRAGLEPRVGQVREKEKKEREREERSADFCLSSCWPLERPFAE